MTSAKHNHALIARALRSMATLATATAYTPCLALYPRYHVSNLPNARGRLFYYQIWSVTDKQTNTISEFIR